MTAEHGQDRPATLGAPGQHLLLTLLGDYWYQRTEPIASAALVALLAEFGMTEQNARAALSRLRRRGLLHPTRDGRRTHYRLTASAADVLAEGTERIFTFGRAPQPWDGRWTCVAFSIPESERPARTALRARLRFLGFAPLYDAAWFTPGDRADAAANVLQELQINAATIITGPVHAFGAGSPARAWDLTSVQADYDDFLTRFNPVAREVRDHTIRGHDALVVRTELIDTWRCFPNVDPGLPTTLHPPAWPQARATALFSEIYDTLGPSATQQVKTIIGTHDPDAAVLIAHHTTQDVLASLRTPEAALHG